MPDTEFYSRREWQVTRGSFGKPTTVKCVTSDGNAEELNGIVTAWHPDYLVIKTADGGVHRVSRADATMVAYDDRLQGPRLPPMSQLYTAGYGEEDIRRIRNAPKFNLGMPHLWDEMYEYAPGFHNDEFKPRRPPTNPLGQYFAGHAPVRPIRPGALQNLGRGMLPKVPSLRGTSRSKQVALFRKWERPYGLDDKLNTTTGPIIRVYGNFTDDKQVWDAFLRQTVIDPKTARQEWALVGIDKLRPVAGL